ncbi:MAG: PilZ domain-containing protein [Pseudomonadota bacterium]
MKEAASKPQFDSAADDASDKEASSAADTKPEAGKDGEQGDELRAAPRFTLLIRAAKLITGHGEFICVIRDVSETGVSLRMFHKVPDDQEVELHMPSGGIYKLDHVWIRDREAGYEFAETVDVAQLIAEAGEYPKRGMRLGLCFPVVIRTLTGKAKGVVENLSQQGARISSDALFAIDQALRIEAEDKLVPLPEVRAKVRWRRDDEYGVVFDDTLSLADFARLAARLQCPRLLD